MKRVAIIGAGMAGVTLARNLSTRAQVTVFDKSRSCSGRLATRRAEVYQFDHGAQYFTMRDPRFSLYLQPHLKTKMVQEWRPRILTFSRTQKPYKRDWFEPHYVAVPGMSALVKELAQDLEVIYATAIQSLQGEAGNWVLRDVEGREHGPFDWVVSACPAAQTASLLPAHFEGRSALDKVKMQACFSLMMGFPILPKTLWQGAVFNDSLLGWAAWNHTKPGRSQSPALVVLSDNQWAEEHLELPLPEIQKLMQAELAALTELRSEAAEVTQIHRWRYANAAHSALSPFLLDQALQLAACGDWCQANRVEAAYLSGAQLADRLFQLLPHL